MLDNRYWNEYCLEWIAFLLGMLFVHQLLVVTVAILLGAVRGKDKPGKFGGNHGWW